LQSLEADITPFAAVLHFTVEFAYSKQMLEPQNILWLVLEEDILQFIFFSFQSRFDLGEHTISLKAL
jgi:hypothetical protein